MVDDHADDHAQREGLCGLVHLLSPPDDFALDDDDDDRLDDDDDRLEDPPLDLFASFTNSAIRGRSPVCSGLCSSRPPGLALTRSGLSSGIS